ncbi:YbaB/EbfC family nucleoid-associated protein [Actinocrispum sp. NPDC049592]|uniref:YbaB/EbfC family nucleoid-associated protein n=1 Tax=Actinocrispum sp. NPDC049592 TaxID=3154835 RepID=UPI003449A179
MKTPDEWMREFETKIADAQAKAAAVQQGLASASGSASSKDGAVSVSVSPTGALTELRLTPEAMDKSHTQLAAEIVAVARKAQRAAAVQVAETFEQVGGAGSETYQMITQYLPAPEEDEEEESSQPWYGYEQEAVEEAPVRPNRPMPRPDEEDDFGGGSIFRNP